jgi:DNA (cytosine-5)-methyltransferase 1
MKLKEKISLEEVCGQTFKIRVVEASEYGKAALTHYLYNHNNVVSQFYKKEAVHHIKRALAIIPKSLWIFNLLTNIAVF